MLGFEVMANKILIDYAKGLTKIDTQSRVPIAIGIAQRGYF